MSKLLAALIGAGVAVGVGYVIWRVCKERDRRDKDEAAERERDAAQASDAEAPQRRPSVSAEAPAANEATPAAPSTAPPALASSAPPASTSAAQPARAASSSTPTRDLTKQLADAGKREPQAASEPAPTPKADAAQVDPMPAPRPADPDALITRSNHDKRTRTGHVHQRPGSLLEQARRIVPDLTLTEYTTARMLTSERFDGTPTDRLTESIAPRGAYGDQGNGGHRIATTPDPALAHVEAAGRVLGDEQRGPRNGEASTTGVIP